MTVRKVKGVEVVEGVFKLSNTTSKLSPDKPVVKYGKNRINPDIRDKYTLLTTITGPEAKAIRKSKDADHGLVLALRR